MPHVLRGAPDTGELAACSCNRRTMTPELCMGYARNYVSARYPDQGVVIMLQREMCAVDGTNRLAAHICILRADLVMGRRFDEGWEREPPSCGSGPRGGSTSATTSRSSSIHARQPPRTEHEWRWQALRSRSGWRGTWGARLSGE